MSQDPPLVYVYTGNALPRYALHNLALTRKRNSGKLIVLTDREASSRHATMVDIREWYDPEPFREFCSRSPLDQYFRGGFWVRAAERFFVLEQFMRHSGLRKLFHIEMDVLALALNGYSDVLDEFGSGVFAPLEAPKQAVASLMYINDASALSNLCEFAIENAHIGNEMKILGHFLFRYPQQGIGLPSNHVFSTEKWPMGHSVVATETGIVDASFVGMWVAGQNPKNTEYSTWNHYHPGLTTHDVTSLRLRVSWRTGTVTIRDDKQGPFVLRAIHVFSKVFGRLRIPGVFRLMVLGSNLPFSLPVVIRSGNLWARLAGILLRRGVARRIATSPRLVRSLATACVRMAYQASHRTLSNRELKALSDWQLWNPWKRGSRAVQLLVRSGQVPWPASEDNSTPGSVPMTSDFSTRAQEEHEIAVRIFSSDADSVVVIDREIEHDNIPIVRHGRRSQLLFLSETKRFPENRLAQDFWGESQVSSAWSFSKHIQVYQPSLVREMFSHSLEEIARWASLEGPEGPRVVSLSQSYGAWLTKKYPRAVRFAQTQTSTQGPEDK